ncbi:hypothetical protein DL98DRAFT_180266 [Cadophora sp. DSE1049]|nr:hypothetical protein DL98DRAFT_180266 [Cadophora sp. DSE1049]
MSHHSTSQAHAADILLRHRQASHSYPITSHHIKSHKASSLICKIIACHALHPLGGREGMEARLFRTALTARNVLRNLPIGYCVRCWTSSGREARNPCCRMNRSCDARLLKGPSWLESAEQLHRLTNNEDRSRARHVLVDVSLKHRGCASASYQLHP